MIRRTSKLRALCQLLEQRLREEQRKPAPSALTIQTLKRRQVQLRAALARTG